MKTCFGILGAGAAVLALSGTAFAADMPAAPQGTVAEAAPSGWNGAYIGAHVGYGPGTFSSQIAQSDPYSIDVSGLFVGGQVGYNFAIVDGIVFGVEGDMSLTNETGTFTDTSTVDYVDNYKLDWTGAVTAHVGIDAGTFMPYLLGGVAFAHGSDDAGSEQGGVTSTATHVGWTVGAGVAAKVSDDVSLFVEGRYADYGTATYNGTAHGSQTGPFSFSGGLTDWTVRGGLNWHIN